MHLTSKLAILPILILVAGCHRGPSASSIRVGMSAQEVRTALGNPLITGTYRNSIPGQQVSQERWSFKQGDDALVVIMENDKVKETSAHVNPIPAMRKKIKEGMTRAQVQAALGDSALGNNPKDPNPNPTWQYMDAVAPIDQMMVAFQGDKVSSITVIPNGAYSIP
jgi:hypothetical protein